MIATAVGFAFYSNRVSVAIRRAHIAPWILSLAVLICCGARIAFPQVNAPSTPATAGSPPEPAGPIAIVPIDASAPDQAATVTGAMSVTQGKALIATSGTVTSGSITTNVILPRRGVLRVCASTTVHLSSDPSVPAGETPGLMMALDHGAVEASFATGTNSDILLTPDFRILIGGPASAEVKVRLGQHGDTCVDNAGANAPYVVVSSVFEGGAYRVQPGQRVMFQHGSLKEVVDQEKEPCGCPAQARPGTNDFPLAQSAGLTPLDKPAPAPTTAEAAKPQPQQQLNEPLVYSAPQAAPDQAEKQPAPTPAPVANPQPVASATAQQAKKKPGFFRSVGRFFKRVFGAD